MKKFAKYLASRPLGTVSFAALLIIYLIMIFAEFIAPYSPTASFPEHTYHPPNGRFYSGKLQAQEWRVTNTVSWKYVRVRGMYQNITFFGKGEPYKLLGLIPAERHLFTTPQGSYPVFLMGADNLGRDLFSRIIYGSRISLTIGFIATFISLILAMLLGGLAGFFGGKTDWTVMRVSEFFMLIPSLYLILFLRSLLSSSMDSGQAYMMITIILSLVGWPGSARTIRGMVHAIKREEFVLNAQLEMIPSPVILAKHIIPQISSLLIVSIALSIPGFIMTETTLSYLGLGITDPAVSWGSLIKRDISTLSNLRSYPWLLSPVWFLLGVTLAFNFLGDVLRDYFDPYHTVFFRWPWQRRSAGNKTTKDTKDTKKDKAKEVNDTHSYTPLDTPLLLMENLIVGFSILRGRSIAHVEAVRGVSFTVNKGEVLGIVGESGSGKSVSTQAIAGLLPANAIVAGSICYEGTEILGQDVSFLRNYRGKKIGMIFQEPGRSYDPLQNMGSVFFETFRNSDPAITRAASDEKAIALLRETGLDNGRERLSNFPHQFSGGQLQRIGIALSLAQGCELLIADEPTTALDVTIQKQIVSLLKTLRVTRRISIIFISHDIDLVAEISDRILVMYGGLVMESGPVGIFTGTAQNTGTIVQNADAGASLDSCRHPYTRALLAASPRFGSHYSQERLITIPGKVTDPASPEPGCPFAPRCAEAKPECAAGIPSLSISGTHELRCLRHINE
ncbi:MAG: dipeptide/oligopeptide/nickel ABC transporter permease/ATP-binding protein [Treponema sp.]|jgi:peptide/nickel transport system permease protein|nr:dipeptide/oligopeptide/nickel ABC transporter permease/ATP-binding protein [Treponema sp.]